MEDSFPRGGSIKKSRNKDEKRPTEEKDLFQTGEDDTQMSKKQLKKKKERLKVDLNVKKQVTKPKTFTVSAEQMKLLTVKMLTTDMLVLGCVKEVREYNILLSLPGGLTGSVPITNISEAYHEQLKLLASPGDGEDDEELNVHSLAEIFPVGTILPCKVVYLGKTKKGKPSVRLTVDPKLVNAGFEASKITDGVVLFGSVASQEDHGYVIDIGVQRVKAFLKNKNAEKFIETYNEGNPLVVGQSVMCKIEGAKEKSSMLSGESRSVSVTIDPEQLESSQITTAMDIPFRSLTPGMKVTVKVQKTTESGVTVKFLQHTGTIHSSHLAVNPKSLKGKEIKACILYIHPTTKALSLSNLPHLVNYKGVPLVGQFGQLTHGQIVEEAEVVKTSNRAVIFHLLDNIKGTCGVHNLSDDPVTDVDKEYKKGSKHRCKVMDLQLIDNLVSITLKRSILEQKYLSIKDIHPGDIIECTVQSVEEKGVRVNLTSSIQGFIPNLHLANSTFNKKITKMFTEGKKLKCRVLKVYEKKKKVILTHKQMLLNTKLPVISELDQVKLGMEAEGFIAKINEHGVLVAFYGDVKGWVPRRYLSKEKIEFPEKVFFLGQVVKARVASIDDETNKIVFSFWVDPNKSFGTKEDTSDDSIQIGEISSCEVTKVTDTGLDVKLSSGKPCFLPVKHLTDSMETNHLLLNCYRAGDSIDQVMCWNKTKMPILSLRKSVLEYGKDHEVVTSIDQLKVGMQIPGTVHNLMSYGVFVQISGKLIGLSPNKLATDLPVKDLNEIYKQDQAVIATVTDIDTERKRFLVSLRMRDCYMGNTDVGVEILSTFLQEREFILSKKIETQEDVNPLYEVKIGQVYQFVIDEVSEDGILGHLPSGVRGMCSKGQMDEDEQYTEDSEVECLVVAIDIANNFVDVVLKEHLVGAKKSNTKGKKKLKAGTDAEGELVVIRKDYMMAVLTGKHSGVVVYLPARKHLNDVMGILKYNIGGVHSMVVKRYTNGNTLCCFKSDENYKAGPRKTIEVGEIVTVRVKDVLDSQLNVFCEGNIGRIHVTELVDTIQDGTQAITPELYKKNAELQVKMIGIRESKPKSESSKPQRLLEFSMKKSKLKDSDVVDSQTFQVGQKVIGFIFKCESNGIWLQVTPTTRGWVSADHLSDDPKVMMNVKNSFKLWTGYNATVLNTRKDGSLQLSLLDNPESKLENSEVTTGSTHTGTICSIERGCGMFVQLSNGYRGVVHLTEISDEFTEDPTSAFDVNGCIECFILNCDKKYKCEFSLRNSRRDKTAAVKDPVVDSVNQLSEGQILRGYVVQVGPKHLLVSCGRNVKGRVAANLTSDYHIDDIQNAFTVGKLVTVKIISISPDKKIEFSMKESDTGIKVGKQKGKKRTSTVNSEENIKRKKNYLTHSKEDDDETSSKKKKKKQKRKNSDSADVSISSSKKLKVTSDSDSGIEDGGSQSEKNGKENDSKACLNIKLGWSWDSEYKPPVVSAPQVSDSEEDEEGETLQETSNKTPQHDQSNIEEKRLFEYEKHQLEGDLSPETAEDFDRMTLQSPDSSLVWLRYMAYHLESAEIEKARAVAERALKTISFREEQEKMNVWVAYLNLENMYGTPEELAKVLERALQQNDQLTVYQHLVNIYVKSGKFQEVENTYNLMTRKFSYKKETWIGYGLFHFKNGNLDAARKILPRSLKSLSKDNHVETIAKFAQMEFKHGEPERGKTMFENILSNYPKRTDLWSVYVDMVIKTGDIQAVRQLLDRVIHMKLSAKKMKFFFKKYLDFERIHGDESHVDMVKKKAFEYVESKGFVDE